MKHPRRKGPPSRLQRAIDFFTRDLWLKEVKSLPWLSSLGLRASRVLVLTARGFQQHRVLVQAAALTYYTALSIVPLLAVSFAVARGLGYDEQLKERAVEPFLERFLGPAVEVEGAGEAGAPAAGPDAAGEAPEGAGADAVPDGAAAENTGLRDAVDQILTFVDKTDDLPLGSVGLLILLYTAIKLLSAVERSMNDVWGVRRGRSWLRRASDYVAIVVVTPILLLVGTVSTAWLRAVEIYDIGLSGLLSVAPFLVIWLGLSFAYLALPNTHVRLRSAAIGGAVAAVLWVASQYVYVELQVGIAKYNALYAGFAAIPILLFWIFLSWAIFLTGAECSYAHQSVPLYTTIARMGTIDHAFREGLAVRLAARIADAFLAGREPPSAEELAGELGIAPRAVNQVLDLLVARGIVARAAGEDDDRFLPANDPDGITVVDVLEALKIEEDTQDPPVTGRLDERVDRILEGLEREARASLHNHTLRELALSTRSEAPAGDDAEAGAAELREASDRSGG